MARLPQPGGDSGNWGSILNDYLAQSHKADGTIKDNIITAATLAPNSVDATSIASDSISEALLNTQVRAKLNANPSPTTGLTVGFSESSVSVVQAGTAVVIALAIGFTSDGISPTRIRLGGGSYSTTSSTTLTWDLYDPLSAQVIRQSVCPAATSGVVPALTIDKVFPAGDRVVQARFKPGSNTTVTVTNTINATDQSPLQLTADKVVFA